MHHNNKRQLFNDINVRTKQQTVNSLAGRDLSAIRRNEKVVRLLYKISAH